MTQTFEQWAKSKYGNTRSLETLENMKIGWTAALASQSANCELTDDEPAVYEGQMYWLKQVGAEEYITFDGECFFLNGGRHIAATFTKDEAEKRKDRWNKRGKTMLEVVPVPAKKKSINLEDTIKLSAEEIVNLANEASAVATEPKKPATYNGLEFVKEGDVVTHPTTLIKWFEVFDTQNTNGYTKKVLKQFHRYLHKEGGEWRDVPTV